MTAMAGVAFLTTPTKMRIIQSLHTCRHRGFHNIARPHRYTSSARHVLSRRKPSYLHDVQATNFSTRGKPSQSSAAKRTWKPVLALLDKFSQSQSRRPYLSQLCLTPLIYCLGDFSAQMIGDEDYDYYRSLRSLAVGLVIAIPSYEWFLFLGRRFNYTSSALSLSAKVATNQLLYTPLFNVYFFAFHGLLSGEGVACAIERVESTVPISIPRSFLYWPLVTAFNFTYVKPQSQAVATSFFAVFWQSYLSWLNSSAEKGTLKGFRKSSAEVQDLGAC